MVSLRTDRYARLSASTIRVANPSGTGKLPKYKYIKDPKSGYIHKELVGFTNLQAQMNEEAKTHDVLTMLKEVDEGTRKRKEGFYTDFTSPKSKYEVVKNAEKVINLWDKNPILRSVYSSKEALSEDIQKGVNVLEKCEKFAKDSYSSIDTEMKKALGDKPKKDIVAEPKKEVVATPDKEIKASEVK